MKATVYNRILVALLIAGSLVYGINWTILYRAGEISDFSTILEQQRQTDGLYFGWFKPPGAYKLAVYAARKPKIIVFGTSRAHNQRQEFYNKPFYSLSGLSYSPGETLEILDLLLPLHKPDIVLYNLDFYSFCTLYQSEATQTTFSRPRDLPRNGWSWYPDNPLTVLPRLLIQGRLSWRDAGRMLTTQTDWTADGVRLFGLSAFIRRGGFRLDGAPIDVDARIVPVETLDHAKEAIRHGNGYYPVGCYYNPVAMAHLEMMQQELKRQNIRLVILVPPIAPSLYQEFLKTDPAINGYYFKFVEELKRRDFEEVHFFFDGALIGAPDAEFSDTIHGGDVSEARMVLKAAEVRGSIMESIADTAFLQTIIRDKAGMIGVPYSYFHAVKSAAWGEFAPVQ